MAEITARMVADLRSTTGLGMMDCKKALIESDGDINKALEILRIKSGVKAGKLSSRTASEGMILITISNKNQGAIIEVNCETDFVAKDDNFKNFVKNIVDLINQESISSLDTLNNFKMSDEGKTVDEYRKDIVAKLGENVCIRRLKYFKSNYTLESYLHGNRIGVIVEYDGQSQVAKDICMHIAALKPLSISSENIDPKVIEQERRIYEEQAKESGKPIDIINKMVDGKVKRFLSETTLLGQNFVKNPDLTVEQFLDQSNTKIFSFTVFELGEGIEKKVVDYAAEVASISKK